MPIISIDLATVFGIEIAKGSIKIGDVRAKMEKHPEQQH